jgi:uracil-DNA glycosylase
MTSRRELMLEEMGLTPIWRLRPGFAARLPLTPTLSPPRGEGVLKGDALLLPAIVSADAAQAGGAATREAVSSQSESESVDTRNDRRALIMRMAWPELKAAVAACRECALHAKRTNTVFGVGDENANWVFVGEGPGADEDALGDPFVGQAGKLLDSMLAAVRLKRGENVYICNVVKCRPPGNRNPEPEEMQKCEPFLRRQIELLQPRLIVALGRIAAQNLLARDASIASLRGRVHDYKGRPLIVTYHPAYLLRNLADKARAWEDLCFAVSTMARLQSAAATSI